MSKSGVFQLLFLSPLYGILIVILTSPLLGVFSRGLFLKETAVTSGKVSQRIV